MSSECNNRVFGISLDLTMGLPQMSSEMDNDLSSTQNMYGSSVPQCSSISSKKNDGLPMDSTESRLEECLVSSVIQDQRNIKSELLNSFNGSYKCKYCVNGHGTEDLHSLKIDSKGKSFSSSKISHDLQSPFSRVVGFEYEGSDDNDSNTPVKTLPDSNRIYITDRFADSVDDYNGSQIKKRMLSPLHVMLSSSDLDGDLIDLSGDEFSSITSTKKNNTFVSKDYKKANIGKNAFLDNSVCPSKNSEYKNKLDRTSSCFFTDGPVLENSHHNFRTHCLSSWESVRCNEPIDVRRETSSIDMSHKILNSPPISLSPLGPKCSERISNLRFEGSIYNELKKQQSRVFFKPETEDEDTLENGTFEDVGVCRNNLSHCTPQGISSVGHNWDPISVPKPHCLTLVKKVNSLPVRRSLIGSFEECLLSGRFSATKVNQVGTILLSFLF